MGGLSWFAIPWLCATTMGLSALALESDPVFPTYPYRMPKADVTAGLVLPNAAVALLGKGGAAATLLLIFMAVTSAMSAELVAVSSIFTYDIYSYFDPTASGAKLIRITHVTVILYAIALASFSTGLYYIGISMGYLYLLMGVIISSAVFPASLTLLWSGQSWAAATFSPPLGLVCSLIAWLVTAKKQGGTLSVATTGANNPMLAGNVVALLSPLIFVPILTLVGGGLQRYDWKSMANIRKGDDSELARRASVDIELVPGETRRTQAENDEERRRLLRASKIARYLCLILALGLLVLWPMPMYGSAYVFSKKFFTGWVSVGILWLFCSAGCVVVYPLWEGRRTSKRTITMAAKDLVGKGGKRGQGMRYTEGIEVKSEVKDMEKTPKQEVHGSSQ